MEPGPTASGYSELIQTHIHRPALCYRCLWTREGRDKRTFTTKINPLQKMCPKHNDKVKGGAVLLRQIYSQEHTLWLCILFNIISYTDTSKGNMYRNPLLQTWTPPVSSGVWPELLSGKCFLCSTCSKLWLMFVCKGRALQMSLVCNRGPYQIHIKLLLLCCSHLILNCSTPFFFSSGSVGLG